MGHADPGKRIHDNWWQTETGAPCISNFKCMTIKPGSMGRPVPGIVAAIVDEKGQKLPPKTEGFLALRPGWPSMMVGIWGNEERYREYFRIPGWYISGDQAYKDEDGYIWFLGRADDVIKTSGERLGPFEVESALIEHPAVAESAVVGKPDELQGRDRQGVHSPPAGTQAFRRAEGRNHPVRQDPSGLLRLSKGDRVRAIAAEDQVRQDHAPGAEGEGARSSRWGSVHPRRVIAEIPESLCSGIRLFERGDCFSVHFHSISGHLIKRSFLNPRIEVSAF